MLGSLSQDNSHLRAIRNAKKLYNIDENELKILTPDCVLQLLRKMEGLNDHLFPSAPCDAPLPLSLQDHWQPNEFKLFSWVAVCYSSVCGRNITNFVLLC
jgi:hypothetical protein